MALAPASKLGFNTQRPASIWPCGFRAWLAELDRETQFCVFWNQVLKVIFRSIQPWLFLSDAASFSLIITATTLDKCWNSSRKTSTAVLAFWAEFKRSKEKTVPGKGTFLRSSKTQTTSKMLEILESNISNKCKPFQDQAVVALNETHTNTHTLPLFLSLPSSEWGKAVGKVPGASHVWESKQARVFDGEEIRAGDAFYVAALRSLQCTPCCHVVLRS